MSEIADVHGHRFAAFVFLLIICLPKELHIFPYGSLIYGKQLVGETG